jgi:hypothetical protein
VAGNAGDCSIGNPPLVIRRISIVADHLYGDMAGLPKVHKEPDIFPKIFRKNQ